MSYAAHCPAQERPRVSLYRVTFASKARGSLLLYVPARTARLAISEARRLVVALGVTLSRRDGFACAGAERIVPAQTQH